MRTWARAICLACAVALVGCDGQANAKAKNGEKTNPGNVTQGLGSVTNSLRQPQLNSDPITQAQPKLRTLKLFVGTDRREVIAEVAQTVLERQAGFMFREKLGPDEGMLFVFEAPQHVSFYMKNTVLPLSAAYLGTNGRILEIHSLEPLVEKPVASVSNAVRFVLEMPKGWFQNRGVQVGDAVISEFGELSRLFSGRP